MSEPIEPEVMREDEPERQVSRRIGKTAKRVSLEAALTDPKVKTIAEAARVAGMSRTHAHRLLRDATAKSAIMARREVNVARGRDRARAIYETAGAHVHAEVSAGADPEFSLKSWSVASRVLAENPESDVEVADETDWAELRDCLLRAYRLGARLGRSRADEIAARLVLKLSGR